MCYFYFLKKHNLLHGEDSKTAYLHLSETEKMKLRYDAFRNKEYSKNQWRRISRKLYYGMSIWDDLNRVYVVFEDFRSRACLAASRFIQKGYLNLGKDVLSIINSIILKSAYDYNAWRRADTIFQKWDQVRYYKEVLLPKIETRLLQEPYNKRSLLRKQKNIQLKMSKIEKWWCPRPISEE